MSIIKDTLRPELDDIKKRLTELNGKKIHVGIQSKAGSFILMIANVHEYGAVIRAKKSKHLAIPIAAEAVEKSPRDFKGLFFIKSKAGHLFGVTKKNKRELIFLFLLLPSVTIPERSFIRASFDKGQKELSEVCKAGVDKVVLQGASAQEAAELIGTRAVAMTQAYIDDGIDPPKGSVTMETTKTAKPLYNSGRLYESISFEVEG